MMTLACPSCATQLQIPPALAGKTVACPKCKAKIRLQPPAEPTAPAPPATDFAFTPNSPTAPPIPAKPKPKAEPKPAPAAPAAADFDWADDEPEHDPVPPKSKKRRPEPEADEESEDEAPPRRADKKKPKSKKHSKEPADSNRLLWFGMAGGGSVAALLLLGGAIYWSTGSSAPPAKVAAAPKGLAPKKGGKIAERTDVADPPQKVEPAIQQLVLPPGPEIGEATGPLPPNLAPETVQKVKKATAFIKVVMNDDLKATGSGWFGLKGGTVVTNAHVVDMLQPYSKDPKKVEVVINSGMPDEKTFLGQVIGVDRDNDLALLSVSGQPKDWPEPLPLSPSSALSELQHVFIFGYPLGESLGREISVNESQISAFRRNEVGNLRYVQVAGGMHPGNSGGPVVDTRGAVIGVSVSVLRGTMINFAVPGDKVRQLVNGRIVDTHVYEPFKEGNTVRLPVEIKTLDPMRRIKGVNVEVWAGPPGKARAGGPTPPVKKDGDGPHTIVEARLETEDATADVDMPQIPKDKVIWVQPVLTDEKGRKLWGNAEPVTPSGLPPLERAAIQLMPQLDHPAERSIHVKESMSFRVMGGISEREIVTAAIDSKVLEKVARTSNGGGQVNWSPGESTRDETFDGKASKDPASASDYVRKVPFKFLLDGQGRLASTFVFRPDPSLDRKAQRGAMAISNALSNSFQMTSIYPPNPNDETRPNVSWYGRSQVYLGLGNRIESAVFISTWNYEGVRMHEGRRRAFVRFKGYFHSPNPRQAALYNNEIEGHVHFDLEDGYVAQSQVKIVSELSDGEGKYGTMVLGFELTRAPGNTYAIVPPKDLVVADALSKMKKLKSLTARLEPNDPKLPIEVMEKIEGLENAKLGGPWPFKAYSVKLEKGKTYVIDMIHTDITPLDPFLILQDKTMKILAQDDDGAGDQNARIIFNCPETDTYRLLASCLPPHVSSSFRIDIHTTDGTGTATIEAEP